MAPDTADHFLRREAEDISQLENLQGKMKGEKGKREYDITCFQFQHCKIDISLCGNLLPDTGLVFSREKHFFSFPLIANSQSDCRTENSLKLPLVYPKPQKWILKWAHFEWISCHLLVVLFWSNSTPWIVEFEAFEFPPPCCKSGKGWGPCGEVTCSRSLTEAMITSETKPRCPDCSILTKELPWNRKKGIFCKIKMSSWHPSFSTQICFRGSLDGSNQSKHQSCVISSGNPKASKTRIELLCYFTAF